MEKIFTLKTLVDFLNTHYKNKKTGNAFNSSDVQSYIKRGFLPTYLTSKKKVLIIETEKVPGVKTYKLK